MSELKAKSFQTMFIRLSVKWLVDAALERKGLQCYEIRMTLLTCKFYKKNLIFTHFHLIAIS